MATGPLRFRTPHIEELPTTQTKQAPGFAWVAVTGPQEDPSKNWGTNNRKRARAQGQGQSDAQKEALSARQQRDIERKIKELNSDGSKDVQIPVPKRDAAAGGGGVSRAGKTPNTKKILASGKTFAHYLDDEEAEIQRTGRRDGDLDVIADADVGIRSSESAFANASATSAEIGYEEDGGVARLPNEAELEALLNAPPLTFNQARSAAPPADAPPPRRFCEVCGYFGRAKCMKCGAMTCSVLCKDTHDEHRCLKFYA